MAAVVPPELRNQAFAIFLNVFETIGWAVFSLGAGVLAATLGIQTVFFWGLVVLMLINAAVLSGLYLSYPGDWPRILKHWSDAGRILLKRAIGACIA